MDDFLKALGALIFLGLSHWLKDRYDKFKRAQEEKKKEEEETRKKEKHSIKNSALIHESVKNIEHELMSIYRPVRMFVFHFYNGEVNLAKLPLLKVTANHEIVLHRGIRYLSEHYQGRPLPEKFYNGIIEAFDKGHYVYSRQDCNNNPPLQDFFDTWGVNSMLFVALKTKEGDPAAVLVMQWPGQEAPINRTDILEIKAEKIKIEKLYATLD